LTITGADLNEFAKLRDHGIKIPDRFRDQFQSEGWHVLREHNTVAIKDEATCGRDGHNLDAIVFRQGREVLVLEHL